MKNRAALLTVGIILSLALLCGCSPQGAAEEPPTATQVELTTPSGPLLGLHSNGISSYKGIPYAKAERFAPPQRLAAWSERRDCQEFGPAAVQVPREPLLMDEDCLYLNVWTPAEAADEKLPVYVWIHGGGFAIGAGSELNYDGTAYAEQGIVVVTINYRLNALGWLSTQETFDQYGTTGNWGFLDQIMALEWVRDNISAFGGDPEKVTIGGESAGSYSVSALILSPLAAGLFQGAIMQSGSVLGIPGNMQYTRGNLERSIEQARQLMYTFDAEDNAAGLAKLRQVDADLLAQMTPLTLDFTTLPALMMLPAFDGYVMPKQPVEALRNGEFNHVNLLWGFNENEGALFVPQTTTTGGYEMLAAKIYGAKQAEAVLEQYPSTGNEPAFQLARDALMHGMFATVMKPFGDALADAGMNVYAYEYDYATAESLAANMGAAHGSEIPYAFGNLPTTATSEQKQVGEEMFNRWVSFIKYGDPNQAETPSGIKWEKYAAGELKGMIFNSKTGYGEFPTGDDVAFFEQIMFGPESTHFD